jgi:hypothetical protein
MCSDLSVAVSVPDAGPDVLPALAEAGVTELVVVASPPAAANAAADWVSELAAKVAGELAGAPPA